MRGMLVSANRIYKFEQRGFEAQSLVNKGLNSNSPYGFWQKGWGPGEDNMRQMGVQGTAWDEAQTEWADYSRQH